MTTTINASNSGSGGLIQTADASGVLALQTAGTTAVTIDASQRAAFVAGTAALPAITTTGDTNTGIFFPAADTIAFAEGGTESMRIDSSGNLGIGTTSPTNGKLVITGNSVTTGQGIRLTGDTAEARFICESATIGAGILGTFSTHPQLFYTDSAERMRIDSSGNVNIGLTGASNRLAVYGPEATMLVRCSTITDGTGRTIIGFQSNAGSGIGSISGNTSSTAYNTSSDYRLKQNIEPMTGALAKVAALKPVTYKWKLDGSDGEGFIAHELAAVCPHAVTGEKDATETVEVKDENGNVTGTEVRPVYQGIDTSFLVATLTAAIQEQQALIISLTARIAALEGTPA
jgi:hypothetical protein